MIASRILVRALNLPLRPERRSALRPFAGRVVALRAGPVRVSLRVSESGEFAPVHSAVHADAEMEAADEFFPNLAAGKKAQTRVAGDPEFLRAVGEALRGAAMDLETQPVAAPLVMGFRAARRAAQVWTPRVGDALVKNQAIANPDAVSQFNRKVDALARAVARMESAAATLSPSSPPSPRVDPSRQESKQ